MKNRLTRLSDKVFGSINAVVDKAFLWNWKKFLPQEMAEEMNFISVILSVLTIMTMAFIYMVVSTFWQIHRTGIDAWRLIALLIGAYTLGVAVKSVVKSFKNIYSGGLDEFKNLLRDVRYRHGLWRRG